MDSAPRSAMMHVLCGRLLLITILAPTMSSWLTFVAHSSVGCGAGSSRELTSNKGSVLAVHAPRGSLGTAQGVVQHGGGALAQLSGAGWRDAASKARRLLPIPGPVSRSAKAGQSREDHGRHGEELCEPPDASISDQAQRELSRGFILISRSVNMFALFTGSGGKFEFSQ